MNSWLILFLKVLIIQIVISENISNIVNGTVNELESNNEVSRQLSRRKRFVIFPDGCSLQLVFCNQVTALIPIGDIFLFGYTAALAWQLPSDPKYIYMFKQYERPLRRNDEVTKTLNYLDESGRIIARVPYKKRLIVNPAFAKRSIENNKITQEGSEKIDRKKMHEREMKKDYIKDVNMNRDTAEFHRNSRLELYTKIEKLLSTIGHNGKQCVLYKLCEAGKLRRGQGTFLHEILTAVFTLPKGEGLDPEDYKVYDTAHSTTDDCLTRFPGCVENRDNEANTSVK